MLIAATSDRCGCFIHKMDNNYTVYKHTAPNGKVYIGITSRKPEARWSNGNGYIRHKHFYGAIKKYGWENIKHEILFENLSKEDACQKEIELIAQYKSNISEFGYNKSTGGELTSLGFHTTEETRQKLSEAHKGKHLSDEAKQKLSEARKGNHPTEETRQKLSEAHKGKHHSDEAKQKIREAHSKKVICVENKIVYTSMLEAEQITGICNSNISQACRGRIKTAGGYHWEYYKEIEL